MSKQKVTLGAGRDLFVAHNKPDKNYSESTRLTIRADTTNVGKHIYIYFPLNLPKNVTINSATLRMTMVDATTTSRSLTVRKVTQGWSASKTTWANAPTTTATGAVIVTKTNQPAYHDWTWNVTTHVQEVVNGADWFGWRISSGEDTPREFVSSEATGAGNKPVLEIEYSEAPFAPQDLSPSGGGAVSTGSPVLSFDYRDNKGVTAMGGFQVKIATNAAMTGVIHDSGTITSTVPLYDLSTATGWTALSNSNPVYWQVRVKDAANNWSDWSDVTSFVYAAKGVLTITAPSASIIRDTTPVIVWSLTSKTQSAWQVIVRNSRGKDLYNSGKYASTTNSWEIPAMFNGNAVIADKNEQYVIVVRVWDTDDRAATVGSDVVYEASKTVTYQQGATGAVPSTPTATDQATVGEPGIALTWTISDAPDRFDIWRDDKKIDSVDPGDIDISPPGTYRYVDYTARGGQTYAYRIGSSSDGIQRESATTTVTKGNQNTKGIWLIDRASNIKVQIMDADEGSWEMGEESQTFTPVGATRSRLVTQALRGYEGSISGLLVQTNTTTVTEQEANMYALKSAAGRTYWLALSDVAIPVVIGNVTVAPTPHKEIVKRVSFNFWQQGNLPFEAIS